MESEVENIELSPEMSAMMKILTSKFREMMDEEMNKRFGPATEVTEQTPVKNDRGKGPAVEAPTEELLTPGNWANSH